jgi:short-subunit dehydrogenase involved in D-alanine esterification of teichoic acids
VLDVKDNDEVGRKHNPHYGGSTELALKFARAFVALKNTVIITGRDVAKLAKAQAQVPELKTIGSDVSRMGVSTT